MSVSISGFRTTIAERFVACLPTDEAVDARTAADVDPVGHARYLFCTGKLIGKAIGDMAIHEAVDTYFVNFHIIAEKCDQIIAANPKARICIIGSESGYRGSFDMAYAGAKAAMHLYIETKKLAYPEQQLVGIAPGIISDAAMTMRRSDKAALESRAMLHPKGRFIWASEVAKLAHFLLYVDQGYISGTVIRMNGGDR